MAPRWTCLQSGWRVARASSSRQAPARDPISFSVPADGAGAPELSVQERGLEVGDFLVRSAQAPRVRARWDIWLLNLSGSPTAEPFLRTAFDEGAPTFSPNGRWIAYESNESGQSEIYVRPLRGPARKWQISTGGGQHPRWSPKGDELLYTSGNRVMTTKVAPGEEFSAGRPIVLTDPRLLLAASVPNYDITPDGHRLLMMRRDATAAPVRSLIVVQDLDAEHWTARAGAVALTGAQLSSPGIRLVNQGFPSRRCDAIASECLCVARS